MQENPKQGSKGLIIFIILALIVIIGGVVIYTQVMNRKTTNPDEASTDKQTNVTDVQPAEQAKPDENKILIDDTNERINVVEIEPN